MSRSSKAARGKTGASFITATLAGVVVGVAVVLGYAYATAEWWLTGRLAGYCALALVPLATALSASVTSLWVARQAGKGRLQNTAPVLIAGLLVFALASLVRVYPVRELTFQLPTYLDADPSLTRAFEDLKHAELPLLSASLGQTFALVYMLIEALVLFATLVLIARLSIALPFCYSCQRYCQRKTDVMRVMPAPTAEVLDHINSRNWHYFRALGPAAADRDDWLRFDVASCPSCGRTNTLSVQLVDKRGKRVHGLVHDLQITHDDLRTVEHLMPPAI